MASYISGSLLSTYLPPEGGVVPFEWKPEYLPIVAGTVSIFAVAVFYGIKKKRRKKK